MKYDIVRVSAAHATEEDNLREWFYPPAWGSPPYSTTHKSIVGCGDWCRHLEKQKELMMDTYRSTSHELHRLQVEEEMIMGKYYEFMEAQDLVDKRKDDTMAKEYVETSRASEEEP